MGSLRTANTMIDGSEHCHMITDMYGAEAAWKKATW